MADLTITAASVRPLAGCIIRRFAAGETLTPGVAVYVSGNDIVSLADGSAVGTAAAVGVVVSDSSGAVSFAQYTAVDVVLHGPVTGYATNLAAGTVVFVDDDAGILADATGTKTCVVGIGLNTTTMLVNPILISTS